MTGGGRPMGKVGPWRESRRAQLSRPAGAEGIAFRKAGAVKSASA